MARCRQIARSCHITFCRSLLSIAWTAASFVQLRTILYAVVVPLAASARPSALQTGMTIEVLDALNPKVKDVLVVVFRCSVCFAYLHFEDRDG